MESNIRIANNFEDSKNTYGCGNGDGDGNGDGNGDGYGDGDGCGYGYGDGYGCGDGNGDGCGYGDGTIVLMEKCPEPKVKAVAGDFDNHMTIHRPVISQEE